jgi:hypothetical protein
MRTFALLLILINVCFLFWSQYIDVQPAATVTTNAESTRAPRLLLATERDASAQAKSKAIAAELSCISIGPFTDHNAAAQAQQRLQNASYGVAPRTEQAEVFAGYWVSLPSFAKRADADQTLQRLRAAGVTDAYLLPDETPPNVISLGLFTEQSHAERRRDEVTKLGLQPQVQTRTHPGELYWLDVSLKEPGQLIDPALLQPENGGIVRLETKPCPTAAGGRSSASSQG